MQSRYGLMACVEVQTHLDDSLFYSNTSYAGCRAHMNKLTVKVAVAADGFVIGVQQQLPGKGCALQSSGQQALLPHRF